MTKVPAVIFGFLTKKDHNRKKLIVVNFQGLKIDRDEYKNQLIQHVPFLLPFLPVGFAEATLHQSKQIISKNFGPNK
jgi:hypothetical protein